MADLKKQLGKIRYVVYVAAAILLMGLGALLGCTPAAAEPIPEGVRASASSAAPGDSATVTGRWTPAAGGGTLYTGTRTTLTLTGRTIAPANLAANAAVHPFVLTRIVGTAGGSESGQYCVAHTRGTDVGPTDCAPVTVVWAARTIPAPELETVEVTIAGPVQGDLSYRIPGPIAELPRHWVNTDLPDSTGRVRHVATAPQLKAALDSVQRGEIIMVADGSYVGNFVLPAKPGDGWVVIRGPRLPEPSVRPDSVNSGFPQLLTANSSPALAAAARASHYRIMGLEFGATPANKHAYAITMLGPVVGDPDSLAHDMILDRVVVKGHDSLQTQRCVYLNSAWSAVVNSYVAGCHMTGFDSQAIFAFNTPGPLKIVNNYLAGAGENILFGGSDPRIPGLIPSDIEIRNNHITKPDWWRDSTWTVKNLYESKCSQRVLLEANVIEHTWKHAQDAAIVLKSENQSGGGTHCTTSDYTIRWNIVRDGPKGMVLVGSQVTKDGGPSVPATRIDVSHNLWEQVGSLQWTLQIGPRLTAVQFDRNTFSAPLWAMFFVGGRDSLNQPRTTELRYTNNVTQHGVGGIGGDSRVGIGALTDYCPACMVDGNAVLGGVAARWPAGNLMLPLGTVPADSFGVDHARLAYKLQGVVVGP